jgi:hypothetical protein
VPDRHHQSYIGLTNISINQAECDAVRPRCCAGTRHSARHLSGH